MVLPTYHCLIATRRAVLLLVRSRPSRCTYSTLANLSNNLAKAGTSIRKGMDTIVGDQTCAMANHPLVSSKNHAWGRDKLRVGILRRHASASSLPDRDFNYAAAYRALDYQALKRDLDALMTDSQPWWPADFGHYGSFFVRTAWHSVGTYRLVDGRGGGGGGHQRFSPLNSWPDNVNLDKARRLLWPIKQKYGQKISWADLIVLAGNVALESMGFRTLGFSGGRLDAWGTDESVCWGSESDWLGHDDRYTNCRQGATKNISADAAAEAGPPDREKHLKPSLAATQMGLIYVNPEGPNGIPDPVAAAHDIRTTFQRMGLSDEETVALIAGGHTFGKGHGVAPLSHLGVTPAASGLTEQGLGWKNSFGSGTGSDAVSSGLEVTWTRTPTRWNYDFLRILFSQDWELTKSPAGLYQWVASHGPHVIPDAFDDAKRHQPTMMTTDLSLRYDPTYKKISVRFLNNPDQFAETFAGAWYKLTHYDMGPRSRYLGPETPAKDFIWQDVLPDADHPIIDNKDVETLKTMISETGLSVSMLASTAWAAASTFRCSDKRGGANGARIRFSPQKDWEVNNPSRLATALGTLAELQSRFNTTQAENNKKVSFADVIVLGGVYAVEQAAKAAGHAVAVPFTPGRTDAVEESIDHTTANYLEPVADGFRNYRRCTDHTNSGALLIDRSDLLSLSAQEMTALVGGMRVLDTNYDCSPHGVWTLRPGTLSNDFFVNLLTMGTVWKAAGQDTYEGLDRATGTRKWVATSLDLVFGSHAELRAIAELYASSDGAERFVRDFIFAWDKVMNLDRFDTQVV